MTSNYTRTDPADAVSRTEITPPARPTPARGGPVAQPELLEAGRLIRAIEGRFNFAVEGFGLVAAVLDTGINADHVDFAGRLGVQLDFTGGAAADGAVDGHGHGTNVAGIIAAKGQHLGIAPSAGIAALKVLPDAGPGSFDWVRNALEWIVQNHETENITVVCMSLGDSSNHADDDDFLFDGIATRIRTLRERRVPVVIAAGNDYFKYQQPGTAYPGILRSCVSVGAVYDDNVGPKAYLNGARAFSTAADRITPFSQRIHPSHHPDVYTRVFAPGAPIRAPGVGGPQAASEMDGTSQATPIVAGTILLLQDYTRRRTGFLPPVDALIAWLRQGGVDVTDGDDEHDNVQNTGKTYRRVDVQGALATGRDALERWADETGFELGD